MWDKWAFLLAALLLNTVVGVLNGEERRNNARNYRREVGPAKGCVWNRQCLKMTPFGFPGNPEEFLEQHTGVLIIKETDR